MNTTHGDGNQVHDVLRELDSYQRSIREAFDEGFAASAFQGPIEAAWECSEARQAEYSFAATRISVGAICRSVTGDGSQPPSGVREDPVAAGGEGAPHATTSSSSESVSLAARALVEQWREQAKSLDIYHATMGIGFHQCADQLSALLAQAGQHEKDQEDLARMDTMGSSADSRTAPTATAIQPEAPRQPWPDPTPEMLSTACFEAIWQCIRKWDINVPDVYVGYTGATGNHVRAILDAIDSPAGDAVREDVR